MGELWGRLFQVQGNAVIKQPSQILTTENHTSPMWSQGMGCLLWVQSMIYDLSLSLQCCMWYHDIQDPVMLAPNCNLENINHVIRALHDIEMTVKPSIHLQHVCLAFTSSAAIRPTSITPYNRGSLYKHGLTLIPVWISNYIHHKVWDEITYPFPNFNGAAVEVWEWLSNFIPHFTRYVITYSC